MIAGDGIEDAATKKSDADQEVEDIKHDRLPYLLWDDWFRKQRRP
jgi:hypothetical protein